MRDSVNPRGGRKQLWVVTTLTLVLVVCVSGLLWLVWSETTDLPAAISESQASEPAPVSSSRSQSSAASSSSKSESSASSSQAAAAQSTRPVQQTYVASSAPAQPLRNLAINAALTHDEDATYYNVFINAGGVTLKNKLVSGDLVLSESVGNGSVMLENVVVKGRILVNGAQTVTLRDVTAMALIAQRSSGTTDYTISGASTVHQMTAKNQLTINEDGLSSNYSGVKMLTTERGAPMWQQVTLLKGMLELVTTNEVTNLMLESGSLINTVVANASTHIGGVGSVNQLTVCSNEVSYEERPRNITIKNSYAAPSEQNWAIGETEAAVNGGNHSGSGSRTLSTPGNLTITANADNSALLAFNGVSNATGYTVVYSVINGSSALNVSGQQLSLDTNSCTITNALIGQAGTEISFKVRAVSTSGRYTPSSYSGIWTKSVVQLNQAGALSLEDLDTGYGVRFQFHAVPNADTYTISYERDIGESGSFGPCSYATAIATPVYLDDGDAVTGFTVTAHAGQDAHYIYLDSTVRYPVP